MGFKSFISIWLAIMISFTLALTIIPRMFSPDRNNAEVATNEKNHFSVQWMGFLPSYSTQYPDYCVSINNLVGNNWTMGIGFQIKNQEDRGYYFQIAANGTPPSGWTLPTVSLGFITVDQTLAFTYNANRSKITSISQGRTTEQIPLVVKAYYDIGLTQLYSEDSFTITFKFLDYASTAWSTLYHDTFDDKTVQGWTYITGYYTVEPSNDYYRSYSYSLRLKNYQSGTLEDGFRKSYTVAAGYSEAYLVFSVRSQQYPSQGLRINYGGTQYFGMNTAPTANAWYQFAVPLPVGQTTQVNIYSAYGYLGTSAYLDDVYVIAK